MRVCMCVFMTMHMPRWLFCQTRSAVAVQSALLPWVCLAKGVVYILYVCLPSKRLQITNNWTPEAAHNVCNWRNKLDKSLSIKSFPQHKFFLFEIIFWLFAFI